MILLHAAGGEDIGIGHLGRCKSLARELLYSSGEAVVLLYEAPYALACKFALPGVPIYIVEDRDEAFDTRKRIIIEFNSKKRILITDLLGLGFDDSKCAREQGFTHLVQLNDSSFPAYQADLFVDGDAFKEEKECVTGFSRLLCGPRYHIVRPDIVARRPSEPWAKKRVDRVLLCLGGADPGRQTEAFLENISGNHTSLDWTIVIGPAFSSERWVHLSKCASTYISLVRSPANMAKLMLNHDIIITLGGLTSYEAMCLGRPVSSVSWSYMAYYVAKLAELDLVENLGEAPIAVGKLLQLCKNPHRLMQIASKGWQTIDGHGATRVAVAIQELA